MNDLWDDYAEFHRAMVESRDLDPVYPVYRALADDLSLSLANRVWLVVAHVAYYHAGSALAAFSGAAGLWDAGMARTDLPCSTERRGHRSPATLSAHLNDVGRRAGDILTWCGDIEYIDEPGDRWDHLAKNLATIHGNGRWAAYKTAEMLQHIAPLPIEARDMGHAFSSGPRKGLDLLYHGLPTGNGADDIARLDAVSDDVVARLGYGATPATAETSLCDFHSLAVGRYYVGLDIDRMQEQLMAVRTSGLIQSAFLARFNTLPHPYLGELHGRTGVDRDRRRAYLETGKIVVR